MSKAKIQVVIEGKDNTKPAFSQVDKSIGGLSAAAKAAGAAIAGALSVGAFGGWIKGASDAAAETGKLAALSNTSSEAFSAWSYAAKSVGIEQDKLGDIFKDVQDKVGDFLSTGGGAMADFFENIAPKVGVTAEQFRNLSGPDALQLYVSSLEKAGVAQSEMVFYLEAIASDSTMLLPLLKNNGAEMARLASEAEELGIVIGEKTAQQAKEFGGQLKELEAIAGSVGNQVTTEMLPPLNSLLGMFVDFVKESRLASAAAFAINVALKTLGTPVVLLGGAFKVLGNTIGGVAAAAAAAVRGEFSEARDIMRDVANDAEAISAATLRKLSGLWQGASDSIGKAAAEQNAHLKDMQTAMALHSIFMKAEHGKLTGAIKKQIGEQTSAEKQALSDLDRIKRERLAIEQRYAEAMAKFSGGGEQDASFVGYQSLKTSAAAALKAGDAETARKQAQAALQMLEELAAAGENTYGFEGLARGLRDIENAALDIEKTNADKRLEVIAINMAMLKAQAEELEKVEIKPSMSTEAADAAKAQMEALAATLGVTMTIPITPVLQPVAGLTTNTIPGDPDVPMPDRYATGGYVRGPGTGTSDSILARLSNGEFVMRAEAVKHYGPALLAAMNGMQLPKFADGGLVGEIAASVVPAQPGKDLGRVTLDVGGQVFELLAEQQDFAKVLHKAALKHGRTTRR